MSALELVRIGDIHPRWLEGIVGPLSRELGVTVTLHDGQLDRDAAYNAARAQYNSRVFLEMLDALPIDPLVRRLGVTNRDLYSSIFTFVFGEAHLGGRCGVISLHRLRPEVYGLPADDGLTLQRAVKEAVHEAGHLWGAVHCREPGCVMNFSGVVEEIDLKGAQFCDSCRESLRAGDPRGG